MADDELCSGFEPQTYLKERCKKCFRLKSKHVLVQQQQQQQQPAPAAPAAAGNAAAPAGGSSTTLRPVERRMSWRDKVYGGGVPASASAPSPASSSPSPVPSQPTPIPVTTYEADSTVPNDSAADGPPSGGLSPQGSERRRGAKSPRNDDDAISVVSFKSANSGMHTSFFIYRISLSPACVHLIVQEIRKQSDFYSVLSFNRCCSRWRTRKFIPKPLPIANDL